MLTRAEAGRIGGLVTLERYGRDHLAEWGRLGGRPRSQTYDDITRQRQRLEQNNNNKEVIQGPPGNLRQLKTLYKLRRGSNGILETAQAGTARETPREQVPAGKESGPD